MGNGRRRDPHGHGGRLAVWSCCTGLLCAAVLVTGCGGSHRTNASLQLGSAVIGHGTTAAGVGYTVWLGAPEPPRGAPRPLPPAGFSGRPASCPMISVATVNAGGFGGPCLTPAVKTVTTTANCAGGFLTVTAI